MSLINNILDLASIEAGYLKLDITRFNIHSMLASVLSLTTERAKKLGISMSLTTTPQIGEMEGDETRIKQVLFSLISNAMKFTEPGGRITLSASAAENGMMELWVEDTGIGIPESDQPQVFTKFFRGQGSGRNRKSGAGLGLSIVRSFIHLHYGSVELVSSPDQGTKVVCRMPRYQGENDKASLSA
jgi:signal transduction histidine kinase